MGQCCREVRHSVDGRGHSGGGRADAAAQMEMDVSVMTDCLEPWTSENDSGKQMWVLMRLVPQVSECQSCQVRDEKSLGLLQTVTVLGRALSPDSFRRAGWWLRLFSTALWQPGTHSEVPLTSPPRKEASFQRPLSPLYHLL